MTVNLNLPRSEALRSAPLDSWVAIDENETRIIAAGATYEEVSQKLDDAGIDDAVIIKTPESWAQFAV
jgi:TPP-dependent indolepyruvate ferredoxin oxidoreductase alpha subunit